MLHSWRRVGGRGSGKVKPALPPPPPALPLRPAQLRHQESAEPAVLEAAVRAEEDSEKAGYRHTT